MAHWRRHIVERRKMRHKIQGNFLANIVGREPALSSYIISINHFSVHGPGPRTHCVYLINGFTQRIGSLERVVLAEDLAHRHGGAIVTGGCAVITVIDGRKVRVQAVQSVLILYQVSGEAIAVDD